MPDLEDILEHLDQQVARLADERDARSPSRFAGQGASPSFVESLAAGAPPRIAPGTSLQAKSSGGIARVMSKALAEGTGSAGGYLVPAEYSGEVLRLLRARSAVMRHGPTIVHVKKELDITALASGASAAYVAENALIPTSEQTFAARVLLRPKQLAALVPVSNRLLRDARDNPSVERIVRDDLAEILALRADLAFLRGTGTGGEPLGIRNTPGLTPAPDLGPDGAQPTFNQLKDMVANLRAVNAPFNKPGWIFNPRLLNTLEKFTDANGRYLADSGLLTFDATGGSGTLLGFPFTTTTQIPINITTGSSTDTTDVYFSSDFSEIWIGENEELTIEVSNEASYTTDGGTTWVSSWQADQSLFRSKTAHDLGLRRPQLVTVMTGVRE